MRKLILILTILAAVSLAQANMTLQLDGLYDTGSNVEMLDDQRIDISYSLAYSQTFENPSWATDEDGPKVISDPHNNWVDPAGLTANWIGPDNPFSNNTSEGFYK